MPPVSYRFYGAGVTLSDQRIYQPKVGYHQSDTVCFIWAGDRLKSKNIPDRIPPVCERFYEAGRLMQ